MVRVIPIQGRHTTIERVSSSKEKEVKTYSLDCFIIKTLYFFFIPGGERPSEIALLGILDYGLALTLGII